MYKLFTRLEHFNERHKNDYLYALVSLTSLNVADLWIETYFCSALEEDFTSQIMQRQKFVIAFNPDEWAKVEKPHVENVDR